MVKKKKLKKLIEKVENEKPSINASKGLAFEMAFRRKGKTIPHKKQFNKKKERKNNKVRV